MRGKSKNRNNQSICYHLREKSRFIRSALPTNEVASDDALMVTKSDRTWVWHSWNQTSDELVTNRGERGRSQRLLPDAPVKPPLMGNAMGRSRYNKFQLWSVAYNRVSEICNSNARRISHVLRIVVCHKSFIVSAVYNRIRLPNQFFLAWVCNASL